jgi:hypothetical protein
MRLLHPIPFRDSHLISCVFAQGILRLCRLLGSFDTSPVSVSHQSIRFAIDRLRESPHRSATVVFVFVGSPDPIHLSHLSLPIHFIAFIRVLGSMGWSILYSGTLASMLAIAINAFVSVFCSVLLLSQQITGLVFPLRCNFTSIVAIVGVNLFGPTLLQSICLSRCLCRSPMSCIHCISSFVLVPALL